MRDGATVKATLPEPVLDAPPAMAIHEVSVLTVHAQAAAVVTVTVSGPPSEEMETCSGETVNTHEPGPGAGPGVGPGAGVGPGTGVGGVSGSWAIVTDCPATSADPLRAAPAFASTLSVMLPLPLCPLDET
jgi:hypothetical protein